MVVPVVLQVLICVPFRVSVDLWISSSACTLIVLDRRRSESAARHKLTLSLLWSTWSRTLHVACLYPSLH